MQLQCQLKGLTSPCLYAQCQPISVQPLCLDAPAAVQASAQGIDLQAADVFFSLCMLQLPQQSMATFFVRSVQSCAELMASLDRMAPLLVSQDRTLVGEASASQNRTMIGEASTSQDRTMAGEASTSQECAGESPSATGKGQKSISSEGTQQKEVRSVSSACFPLKLLCYRAEVVAFYNYLCTAQPAYHFL